MAIIPIQISQVSNLLTASIADQSITSTQTQLLNVQNELSTGKAINQPSDNPAGAALILSLNKTLSQQTAYTTNNNAAQTNLGAVDSALSNVGNLLLQAQNIASTDSQSTATADQRQGDAQVVNSLLTEIQNLANTQGANGAYIFGGEKGDTQPYVNGAGGVQFVGSSAVPQALVGNGVLAPTTISGASVFGGASSRVQGTNLDPAVSPQTQISTLGGASGNGVTLGTIQLSNGTTTANVDLSQAQTLGDVVNDINSADVGGITATLAQDGIDLTGGPSDNITVNDLSATGAANLGIATGAGGAGDGTAVDGANLGPKITNLTPLSTLDGGNGIDSAGIVIGNGITTQTLTFSPSGDVESVLNAINGAGLGVQASINSTGTGINVQNTTQGTTLTIGENGGQTATDLGIRSFSPSSPLSELNNGTGVSSLPAGSGGDFSITDAAGTSFTVSVAGAQTVQDVLNSINAASTAAGSGVTAGFTTQGNGIQLVDNSSGPGKLTLQSLGGSDADADLGLTSPAAGNSITGTDVNGIQSSGVFSDLSALATALTNGDQAGITAAGTALQNDYNTATDARGLAGAQVDSLENNLTQMQSQNTATQQLLSNVQDVNMTNAISQFQTLQTALQASLLTTAQSQQLSLLNFLS